MSESDQNKVCCRLTRTMIMLDPDAIVVSWKMCVRNGGLRCARTEGQDACSLLGVKEKCRSCSQDD